MRFHSFAAAALWLVAAGCGSELAERPLVPVAAKGAE
jgi:hypothetical protein